nr:MAG TPA: hypothetical protein [Caudoviricetes sp.]
MNMIHHNIIYKQSHFTKHVLCRLGRLILYISSFNHNFIPPHRLYIYINAFFGIFLHTFFTCDKFSKHVAVNNSSIFN